MRNWIWLFVVFLAVPSLALAQVAPDAEPMGTPERAYVRLARPLVGTESLFDVTTPRRRCEQTLISGSWYVVDAACAEHQRLYTADTGGDGVAVVRGGFELSGDAAGRVVNLSTPLNPGDLLSTGPNSGPLYCLWTRLSTESTTHQYLVAGHCAIAGANLYRHQPGGTNRQPLTVTAARASQETDNSCSEVHWCERIRAGDPDAVYLCVDVGESERYDEHFLYPPGYDRSLGIMQPNRRIVVASRYLVAAGRPAVEVPPGQIDFEEPHIRSVRPPESGVVTSEVAASSAPTPVCQTNRITTIPSLRSGRTQVTFKYRYTRSEAERSQAITLLVEPAYGGAIRFGLATVFGPAVSHQYSVLTAPGAGQRELGLSFTGNAEFELVVGATAFVWDLIGRGGRTYITPRPWWSYVIPSPLIGMGVIGTLGDKVSAFQSLHLGGEWEFTRAFSIAATAVLRRTTRLNDGLSVGSPVSGDDIGAFTHAELNWGFGLVVNFSPELLQVATPTIPSR